MSEREKRAFDKIPNHYRWGNREEVKWERKHRRALVRDGLKKLALTFSKPRPR